MACTDSLSFYINVQDLKFHVSTTFGCDDDTSPDSGYPKISRPIDCLEKSGAKYPVTRHHIPAKTKTTTAPVKKPKIFEMRPHKCKIINTDSDLIVNQNMLGSD